MSLPTHKFERLSIKSGMPATTRGQSSRSLSDGQSLPSPTRGIGEIALDKALSETVRLDAATLQQRAYEVRDILSTFDRDDFPTEYIDEAACRRIGMLEEPKPLEDCLEAADLKSTVFQLAANSSIVYWIFRQLLPEEICAQYYAQKFNRRVRSQFDLFDKIQPDPEEAVELSGEAGDEVDHVAAQLRHIVENARVDREQRMHGDKEMAAHLVDMLQDVCVRNKHPSLFHALIGNPSNPEPNFGLDALEKLPKGTLLEQTNGLDNLRTLLIQNGAPPEYRRAFDVVRRPLRAEGAEEGTSSLKRPAGGSGSGSGRGKHKKPNRS